MNFRRRGEEGGQSPEGDEGGGGGVVRRVIEGATCKMRRRDSRRRGRGREREVDELVDSAAVGASTNSLGLGTVEETDYVEVVKHRAAAL